MKVKRRTLRFHGSSKFKDQVLPIRLGGEKKALRNIKPWRRGPAELKFRPLRESPVPLVMTSLSWRRGPMGLGPRLLRRGCPLSGSGISEAC